MLTIARITTTPFRLPMHGSLRWGKASVLDELHHVLVQVTLSDGSSGVAEAPPRPTIYGETVASITHIIQEELAPRLLGLPLTPAEGDPTAWPSLQSIQTKLHEVKYNQTALGALDMALHDALAQHRGMGLGEHLGAQAAEIQVSYILGIDDPEKALAEAERVVAQGVRVLKVKVGRRWEADLALVQELRRGLGPQVRLYADANECLTAAEAPARLASLAEAGLLYCEEPLPVELIRERAALAPLSALPLIADDSAFSLRDLQRELAFNTFHILNIKTARTGYTESAQMVTHARAAGKGIMVGSQASAGLGTVRAALFAARPGIAHPCELSFFLKLKADLLDRPIPIRNGAIHLEDLVAVRLDEARLRDCTAPVPR